ncbi:MAG: hypothetical protein IJI46_07645 [Erysipelotrichaceae bacterium]|nr:hypothetical protein [Clostridia bacterium]MBQ6334922.1 hypothetical protein [Erysipelotrichaceae bacterium]
MSFCEERTFRKDVTSHRENREKELGRNQEDRENAVKSMVSAIRSFPKIPQKRCAFPKNDFWEKLGENLGKPKKGCQV